MKFKFDRAAAQTTWAAFFAAMFASKTPLVAPPAPGGPAVPVSGPGNLPPGPAPGGPVDRSTPVVITTTSGTTGGIPDWLKNHPAYDPANTFVPDPNAPPMGVPATPIANAPPLTEAQIAAQSAPLGAKYGMTTAEFMHGRYGWWARDPYQVFADGSKIADIPGALEERAARQQQYKDTGIF